MILRHQTFTLPLPLLILTKHTGNMQRKRFPTFRRPVAIFLPINLMKHQKSCRLQTVRMLPTNFVVDAALQVSYGGPTLFLLHLGVIVKDLVPQPGQVVYTQLVLLTCCWWRNTRGGGERSRERATYGQPLFYISYILYSRLHSKLCICDFCHQPHTHGLFYVSMWALLKNEQTGTIQSNAGWKPPVMSLLAAECLLRFSSSW